jgi:transglutaminase-like putative cysteine protease
VAQITRSEEPIARVEVYENDRRVTTPQPLTLRGSALDFYTGAIPSGDGRWTWLRSNDPSDESVPRIADPFGVTPLGPPGENSIRQVITLQPTGTNKLFGIAGVKSITTEREMEVFYFQRDGVIESGLLLRTPLQYTVTSTGELPTPDWFSLSNLYFPFRRSHIDPQVRKFAQQPQVCGTDSGGSLARYPLANNHEFDAQIAVNFETYLRRNYSYTLDLTDAAGIGDRDPLVAFLTDFKKGHCEYFAGAMTLMCQSLGIPARMIVGFSCDPSDFNTMGNYFLVKQSNAHAWVEVFTGKKWETFDPTTARLASAVSTGPKQGMGPLKSFFDFLEYKWDNAIIAYDQKDRSKLVGSLDYQISRTANQTSKGISQWWSDVQWNLPSTLISGAIAVMAIFGLGVLIWYLRGQIRLRRRASRFGLKSLATGEQLRLARQLEFYDELIQLLEQHRIVRPRHQTPMEFSRSLTFLPSIAYDDIIRLTRMFYRVRYGAGQLNAIRQRHLSMMVIRIGHALG